MVCRRFAEMGSRPIFNSRRLSIFYGSVQRSLLRKPVPVLYGVKERFYHFGLNEVAVELI